MYRNKYIQTSAQARQCLLEPIQDTTSQSDWAVQAIKNGDHIELNFLFNKPVGIYPRGPTISGIPLLSLAVAHSRTGCVGALLDAHADPNEKGWWHDAQPLDYVTPIFMSKGDASRETILEGLIKRGGYFTHMNAFDGLCDMGEEGVELLKQAVTNGTILPHLRSSNGITVLHRAAEHFPHAEEVHDYLVREFPELIDVKDVLDRSVLYYSVLGGNERLSGRYLETPNIIDEELHRDEIMELVILHNQLRLARVLLYHPQFRIFPGHATRPFSETPLGWALMYGTKRMASTVIGHEMMRITEPVREEALQYIESNDFPGEWLNRVRHIPLLQDSDIEACVPPRIVSQSFLQALSYVSWSEESSESEIPECPELGHTDEEGHTGSA
ncbi:hypothetical protein BO71DRAFT_341152 [Aspergillus ellipticus CBS 707.79]|uniref:Ankyrin n=1 Tax=Aspergillus ellipticus CBS 707.79 TaxID=1448320 RepID=A0A319CSC8_9EURO|nr:hypothetical protein BO71DRAFT_341152 [Aspergillus ellipticus CBS 707.79]